MSVENTTTIAGLVTTNPVIRDPVHEGTNHFWLIKRVLKSIFPGRAGGGFARPIVANEDDLNTLQGLYDHGILIGKPLKDRLQDNYTAILNLEATCTALLNRIFPVGSIYTTVLNLDPKIILNLPASVWTPFGQGRVIVNVDPSTTTFGAVKRTGGFRDAQLPEHTHIATVVMPLSGGHKHTYTYPLANQVFGGGTNWGSNQKADYQTGPSGVGLNEGDHTHSIGVSNSTVGVPPLDRNLPPFITAYMWERLQ